MTARDPGQRPTSAAAALAELDPTATLPPTAPIDAGADPTLPIRAARRTGFGFAGFTLRRPQAIAAAAVLVVVLLIIVIAASSGGGASQKLQPVQLQAAPQSAPADAQITQMEKIVRAAPGR